MKKVIVISVVALAMSAASGAFAWDMWIQNYNAWLDHEGNGIHIGLIQFIVDGDGDGVDDPMYWVMAQADPLQALDDWLAAGCPAVGDDYIYAASWNPLHCEDYGDPAYDGYFGNQTAAGSGLLDPAAQVYLRVFEDPIPNVYTYYGTVGDDAGNETWTFQENNVGSNFVDYLFETYVLQTDTRMIVPEPMILCGGVALLLGFIRRKKK